MHYLNYRHIIHLLMFLACLAGPQQLQCAETGQKEEQLSIKELQRRMKAMEEELKELKAYQKKQQETEQEEALEKLRRMAEAKAQESLPPEEELQSSSGSTFGGLSLQALNPELSVVGDVTGTFHYHSTTQERWDTDFRTFGIHFQSYLDPYTRLKAAIPVTDNDAKLGEAYITRYGVFYPGINVTVGKFRQQFGVVNRWHKHGLDQVDFPLPLRRIFGNGGLNQTGVSIDWAMPDLWGTSQSMMLQVTDGENDRLFSGNHLSTPAALLRYTNYRDLTRNTYLDAGVSALIGFNDDWDIKSGDTVITDGKSLSTRVLGLDFCVLWEPTDNMRYRNIEWRTEAYLLNRDLLAPDDAKRDTINAWGAFSYLQSKLSRTLAAGLRFDCFKPDDKRYAGLVDSVASFTATAADTFQWQLTPYITWEQSPFVRFRLEYDHLNGKGTGSPDHMVILQVIFAAGPHKHERY